VRHQSIFEFEDLSVAGLDEAQQAAQREIVERLYTAIRQLLKTDAALVLLYLDDLSYRQMAEVLGISESNVGVKLNRAKKALRELMNEDSHEP
jgi:RNA polymerase sigma-70 factor, ECF subfamily